MLKSFPYILLIIVSTYSAYLTPIAMCEMRRRIVAEVQSWPEATNAKQDEQVDEIANIISVKLPHIKGVN